MTSGPATFGGAGILRERSLMTFSNSISNIAWSTKFYRCFTCSLLSVSFRMCNTSMQFVRISNIFL